MRQLPKTIALLTSCAVLVALALPGLSHWDSFALAASVAMLGLGLVYPWALSGERADTGLAARRDMQEVDVGPATTAILF